jgi:hypothetical protein
MMRAFINETTARLRCVRVFVKLRSVACATICCLPHMAIMCHHERGSKDIFRPYTEAYACWRCEFLFLGPPEWLIFRAYVKADFVTSTPLCGLPMWTPLWPVRRSLSKLVCDKKTRTFRAEEKTFSLLRHAPPWTCVCESRKTANLKRSKGLYLTNLATGNPNLDPYRPENEI